MNDSSTIDEQVRSYANAVGEHLTDLPAEARAELIADLEQHLVEVAADSEQPLATSLGPPSAYAAELRTTAGFSSAPPTRGDHSLVATLQRAIERIHDNPRLAAASALAAELRPAWWVARGLAPVLFVASLSYETSRGAGWFFAGIVGVSVSVAIGRSGTMRADARVGVAAINAVAAALLLLVLAEFIQYGFPIRYQTYVEEVAPRHLVHPGGEPITNIHAFDAAGNPVTGIFLYDGSGKPIEVRRGAPEMFGIETDYLRGADGTTVRNYFPLQQYVEGTDADGTTSLRPRPAPRVVIPPLTTPEIDATASPEPSASSERPQPAPEETTRRRGADDRAP